MSDEQPQPPPQQERDQSTPAEAPVAPVVEVPAPTEPAAPAAAPAPPSEASLPTEEVHFDGTFAAKVPEADVADPVAEKAVPPPVVAAQSTTAAPAPAASAAAAPEGASASAADDRAHELHHHLYRAKALSERLIAVMSQREERLAEIKRRVGLLEPGGESVQPLIEAENNMRDAHTRMKAVLTDLGKELESAGVTQLPPLENQLTDLPDHTGQQDEVAFLYKNLLLALGEWKAAQKRQAAERAESLGKQVAALREQVAREHAETQRIRQRKEHLEQLRQEKQVELDNIKKDPKEPDGDNGHKE